MKKVLISGGSGLLGKRLSQLLEERAYEVSILSRFKSERDDNRILWYIGNNSIDTERIGEFDHIIHLAGAGIIDKAWTAKRKKEIIDSRVESTNLIAKALKENNHKVKSFVSASAVGYYGCVTTDYIFKEEDAPGNGFIAESCKLWEESTQKIEQLGIKTARIRIGIVLAKEGGALKEMANPIKNFIGAPLGSGKQYIPWIHIDDLCRLFIFVIENALEGNFNAVNPNQNTNKELVQSIAKAINRPIWLPNVPSFIIRMILGNRADLVLEGSRISPQKIIDAGFEFKYDDLIETIQDIYT